MDLDLLLIRRPVLDLCIDLASCLVPRNLLDLLDLQDLPDLRSPEQLDHRAPVGGSRPRPTKIDSKMAVGSWFVHIVVLLKLILMRKAQNDKLKVPFLNPVLLCFTGWNHGRRGRRRLERVLVVRECSCHEATIARIARIMQLLVEP